MIHRLTIRNFKSLEEVSVELAPITVLIGESGTGKTNFVTALRYLRDYLYFGEPRHPEFRDWRPLLPATKPACEMSFEVEFDVKGIEESFTYCVTLLEGGSGNWPIINESLRLGDRVYFEQAQGEWRVEPQPAPALRRNLPAIGCLPAIPEVVIAYTALTAGIGCYQFPATVLGAATKGNTPAEENGSEALPGLRDDGANYLRVLKGILINLQDLNTRKVITSTLRHLNPSVSSIALDALRETQAVVVAHRFGEETLPLPLAWESEGFRRFFAHLLALYQQPSKQTLIFEEPENGIYPGALALLTDEFKAAAHIGRGQILLTTHSPGLLDQFPEEAIRVVELEGLQTRIGRVSPEQRAALEERLLEPGELLTVDQARLETEMGA
uniref:Predicted ATPase n=1 Tax=Candidatus Kentrum eta TaxID=2126337 RepID=A0A450UWD4_9GAMM|nr:MAG: Predicted ATPase [Candidatus Kentron sp. H]VFJ96846.1 MAG: Predicted ATPase [Candidatus Kentron sp. H]VFK02617.1 MAG: Predicted ATPase [Candidatus Kentron sp. H]